MIGVAGSSGVSIVEVLDAFPDIPVDYDDHDFYAGLIVHELRLRQCRACACWHHPPRPICPRCWSYDIESKSVSGDGIVHSAIWLHRGGRWAHLGSPYAIAAVDLAEPTGVRFSAPVIDADPRRDLIGTPVTLAWVEHDGVPVPCFRPTLPDDDGAAAR